MNVVCIKIVKCLSGYLLFPGISWGDSQTSFVLLSRLSLDCSCWLTSSVWVGSILLMMVHGNTRIKQTKTTLLTSVFITKVGEPPDVAKTHSVSQTWEEEITLVVPRPSLCLCIFLSFTLAHFICLLLILTVLVGFYLLMTCCSAPLCYWCMNRTGWCSMCWPSVQIIFPLMTTICDPLLLCINTIWNRIIRFRLCCWLCCHGLMFHDLESLLD